MSAAYDTFLFLLDPSAETAATSSLQAATPAQIVFPLTSTGTWFIAANAFEPNVVGAYTLTLACGAAPPPGSTGPFRCCR